MSHMPPLAQAFVKAIRNTIATLPTKEEFKDAPAQIEAALQDFHALIEHHGDAGRIAFLLFNAEYNHAVSPFKGHFDTMAIDLDELAQAGIVVDQEEPPLLPQVDQEI